MPLLRKSQSGGVNGAGRSESTPALPQCGQMPVGIDNSMGDDMSMGPCSLTINGTDEKKRLPAGRYRRAGKAPVKGRGEDMCSGDEALARAIDETNRFRRRCAEQLQNRRTRPVADLPRVDLHPFAALCDINPASPSPVIRASIRADGGLRVGEMEFAISPLLDCVFVQRIRVEYEFRRRKFGTAALKALSDQYGGLPLVITHEKLGSHAFWSHVYRLTPWIPILDPDQETEDLHRSRFTHLQPVYEGWLRDRECRRAQPGWVPIGTAGCKAG